MKFLSWSKNKERQKEKKQKKERKKKKKERKKERENEIENVIERETTWFWVSEHQLKTKWYYRQTLDDRFGLHCKAHKQHSLVRGSSADETLKIETSQKFKLELKPFNIFQGCLSGAKIFNTNSFLDEVLNCFFYILRA